jgi:serine/threonine protein kinase
VFELLGPSLEDLFTYCDGKFSLKTVLMIADQLIPCLRRMHHKYTHRDIKPENILKGVGMKGNQFFITDVGLAEENQEELWHSHVRGNGPMKGTIRYASIRAHSGNGNNL